MLFGRLRRTLGGSQAQDQHDHPITPADGVCAISDCKDRYPALIRGTVTSTDVTDTGFVATVDDGSGHIRLVWLGRHKLAGVQPGVSITAEGTVGRDKRSRKQILDPKFTIMAE